MSALAVASTVDARAVPGASGGRDARVTATMIVVVAALNVSLLVYDHQPIGWGGLVCSSLTLWLCAFPVWRFLLARRRTIPYMAIIGIAYAVYYVLPVAGSVPFFRGTVARDVGFESVEYAAEIALLGVFMLMVGAFGLGPLLRRLPRMRREVDLERALPYLPFIALLSFAVRATTLNVKLGSIGQFVQVIYFAGEISLGLILVASLRGRALWYYKVLWGVLVAALAAVLLATGLLGNAVLPMLVFIYSWERRRIPWGLLLAGALAIAPFNLSKQRFRAVHWKSMSDLGPAEMAALAGDFVSLTYDMVSGGELSAEEIGRASVARANALALLSVVVHDTPRVIPYWNGYSYSELPFHAIPRVLWPDKLTISFGQEFGHRYEFLEYHDSETAISLGQLIECYVNFGPVGVGIGMLIIGFLSAATEYCLSATVAAAAIGSVVLSSRLLNIEANFTLMFAGIPYTVFALYVFVWFLPPAKGEAIAPA